MSISALGPCFAGLPYPTAAPGAVLGFHLVAAANGAAADSVNLSVWQLIVLAAVMALAVVLAVATGVFRPARVDGPLRLAPNLPLWPLAAAIGLGLVVWYGSNVFYFAVKQVVHQGSTAAAPTSRPADNGGKVDKNERPELTAIDFAVLSTVPGLIAFVFLYAADQKLNRSLQLQLGFTRRRFVDGVAKGLLASVMIMPAMYVALFLVELLYLRVGFKHPGEHALLREMSDAKSPVLRGLLIGGAIVTAPFFEEYLFRGFLQTFLRQVFIRWRTIAGTWPVLPVAVVPSGPGAIPAAEVTVTTLQPGDLNLACSPEAPALPRVWQTWAAILITALLFASIHEPWSAPIIFILAVFLGYAYERTGSLWTTITIHLVFNTTSTIIYLAQSS